MKIVIKNIGKVRDASICIDGITVIGGKNGTGKSTISRALFSMFNTFHQYSQKIRQERMDSICDALRAQSMMLNHLLIERIVEERNLYSDDLATLTALLSSNPSMIVPSRFSEDKTPVDLRKIAKSIQDILRISDGEILEEIAGRILKSEFNSQPLNIYSNEAGSITLSIKGKDISMDLRPGSLAITGSEELEKTAIYIDDPFVLDALDKVYLSHSCSWSDNHRNILSDMLLNTQAKQSPIASILSDRKAERILSKLATVCTGSISSKETAAIPGMTGLKATEYSYTEGNADKKIMFQNLSSGLKTFVLLKLLIENGILEDNGVMILDEPEIHLHPEWQLVLAELLILIQQEYGMHILINTHSPYFLDAIDVYAAKHGIREKCRFYLSSDDGGYADFEDVSANIDRIYKLLANPFQTLENTRFDDEET